MSIPGRPIDDKQRWSGCNSTSLCVQATLQKPATKRTSPCYAIMVGRTTVRTRTVSTAQTSSVCSHCLGVRQRRPETKAPIRATLLTCQPTTTFASSFRRTRTPGPPFTPDQKLLYSRNNTHNLHRVRFQSPKADQFGHIHSHSLNTFLCLVVIRPKPAHFGHYRTSQPMFSTRFDRL